MSRSRAIRSALALGLAAATALSLSACFGGPTVAESPKPEVTGFGTIDGETPEPIDTSEPVEPTEAPEDGYETLTDDFEVLTIQVPASWSDVTGQPFTTEDGQQWASLAAAPDLDAYFDTFGTSGVEFAATTLSAPVEDADLAAFLTSLGAFFDNGCEPEDTQLTYDDGFYTGFYSSWTDCGGAGTYGFAIVAVNPDATHIAYVRGQIVDGEDRDAIINVITATFQASI